MSTCMLPNCHNAVEWKSLCRTCHGVATKAVNDGVTTWEELEANGLCRLGRNPMELALVVLKQKQELQKRVEALEEDTADLRERSIRICSAEFRKEPRPKCDECGGGGYGAHGQPGDKPCYKCNS